MKRKYLHIGVDESQRIFCKKKSLEEYTECKSIYIKFKETCTINKLLRNTHLCGKIINENRREQHVEGETKNVLKVTKMYFLSWGGWYKFDHFIIFI